MALVRLADPEDVCTGTRSTFGTGKGTAIAAARARFGSADELRAAIDAARG